MTRAATELALIFTSVLPKLAAIGSGVSNTGKENGRNGQHQSCRIRQTSTDAVVRKFERVLNIKLMVERTAENPLPQQCRP